MEPTAAQTFEAWATGATAITAGVAIFIGGIWAFWKFIIAGPFGPGWETRVYGCSARKLPSGEYLYMADLDVINPSSTVYTLKSVSARLFDPSESEYKETLAGKNVDYKFSEAFGTVKLDDEPVGAGVRRTIHRSGLGSTILYDLVLVAWELNYSRPRCFGMRGLGKVQEVFRGHQSIAVDAESLTRYQQLPKEKNDN